VTEAAAAEELKVFKARKGPAEEVWEAELAAEPAHVEEPEDCLAGKRPRRS
jgi:hypothetical protein